MANIVANTELEHKIIEALKTVFDPEVPVNIYELGLIYEVNVDDQKNVKIVMTLTAPNCPVAESLPVEVEETIKALEGVNEVEVVLTFEPSWDQDMMSEEAKLDLGLL
ncbi:MAG: SUF system Fe-S cluster assembly protein [Bacteroidetes bacterium HGW-Bacteroidetes-17]|jgi:FeS assembly SUF system protein|nr:MAG: SUF system Fe-S cluster assembly protein [Bacteroidetes bacterium HGW-Bacteroidetes-17]